MEMVRVVRSNGGFYLMYKENLWSETVLMYL